MIDEQIERQAIRTNLAMLNGDEVYAIEKAILASLERLKAIDAVKIPKYPKVDGISEFQALGIMHNYASTLRDLLKRETYLHQLDHSLADQWLKRAEAAEAKLAAIERGEK